MFSNVTLLSRVLKCFRADSRMREPGRSQDLQLKADVVLL